MLARGGERPQCLQSRGTRACHARVLERVAKSEFPLKGSGFQKWRAPILTRLNGFSPSNTLAWFVLMKKLVENESELNKVAREWSTEWGPLSWREATGVPRLHENATP